MFFYYTIFYAGIHLLYSYCIIDVFFKFSIILMTFIRPKAWSITISGHKYDTVSYYWYSMLIIMR